MKNLSQIESERLLLRKPKITDLNAAFEIHGDPETNRFNPNGPALRQETEIMLEEWLEHWEQYCFGYWAVYRQSDPGYVIGFGGVQYKMITDRSCLNLYFRFRPIAWGQGYATEMAYTALVVAFDVLAEDHLLGLVRPSNRPSIKILERIGMILNGSLEDIAGREPQHIYELQVGRYRERFNPLAERILKQTEN